MALIPGKMGLKPTIQERKAVGIPPLPSHCKTPKTQVSP